MSLTLLKTLCILLSISFNLLSTPTHALTDGETIGLKDMQAEWGSQTGWTGAPSCSWAGITCDPAGNVREMFVSPPYLPFFPFESLI